MQLGVCKVPLGDRVASGQIVVHCAWSIADRNGALVSCRYVAQGAIGRAQVGTLQIASGGLLIAGGQVANCSLEVAGRKLQYIRMLQIANCKWAHCKLQLRDCNLQWSGCKLQLGGYNLQLGDCKLQLEGNCIWGLWEERVHNEQFLFWLWQFRFTLSWSKNSSFPDSPLLKLSLTMG